MDTGEHTHFNAGELRMVQLYRRSHLSNWWTSEETFREFCCTTIQLAIENLVLQNILNLSTVDTGIKILLIKIKDFSDFLTAADTAIETRRLGLIEKHLVAEIKAKPGRTAADYVHAIVSNLLPEKEYGNPGRKIIEAIVFASRFQYWEVNTKEQLFSSQINFKIHEAREDEMVHALNSISRPVIVARNHNRAFKEFSDRLYNEIDSSLEAKRIKRESS
jgi:hypothetical protein